MCLSAHSTAIARLKRAAVCVPALDTGATISTAVIIFCSFLRCCAFDWSLCATIQFVFHWISQFLNFAPIHSHVALLVLHESLLCVCKNWYYVFFNLSNFHRQRFYFFFCNFPNWHTHTRHVCFRAPDLLVLFKQPLLIAHFAQLLSDVCHQLLLANFICALNEFAFAFVLNLIQ